MSFEPELEMGLKREEADGTKKGKRKQKMGIGACRVFTFLLYVLQRRERDVTKVVCIAEERQRCYRGWGSTSFDFRVFYLNDELTLGFNKT